MANPVLRIEMCQVQTCIVAAKIGSRFCKYHSCAICGGRGCEACNHSGIRTEKAPPEKVQAP